MKNMEIPKQTVVIPIRNEEKFIAATIGYIQNLDYPADRLEIIVVDGQSDDSTVEIVEAMAARDSRIRLLHNPKRLSSAARNIGAREATGEIVTYIDGHTFIEGDQLLKNIARAMEEKGVSVLSRPQFLETPDNDFFQRAVALARRSALGHGLDSTIYLADDRFVEPTSSGASYRKEVFERVGYFDERFDAAEDWEFNFRTHLAGYKSFTSKGLAVYYYPRNSFSGLFRQMKRYGVGRFRFWRKHKKGLSSGSLFPALFVAGPPMMALLSLFSPLFLYILAGAIGLYLTLNLASSLYVASRSGWQYLRVLPMIYFTIHWALGWGFLSEMVNTFMGKRPALKAVSV